MDLLVKKYRDPDRPGLLNYLNMHNDLEALGQQMLQEEATSWNQVTNISEFLPIQVCTSVVYRDFQVCGC